GLLDEKLSTWADHDDLVLTATQAGLPVIYDPRSCVEYDDPGTSNNVLKLSDIPYFLLRWGEAVNESAINHASRKWGCDPNDPWIRHANEWIRYRRRKVCRMIGPGGRLLAFVLFRLNRKLGSRLERMLCGLATRKLDQKRSAALSPSLSKS
ncbi:MAG: hypothetical protein KDA87_26675, partial [Planctomycetales bacterium]|nr:hypothetical protein [Planctomycetales bacterium]